MGDAAADAVTERLELLEARPALERGAARRLRQVAAELEAAGVPKERYEAQKVCAMLLRTAARLDKWAAVDQRRVASVHQGLRSRKSASAAAQAVVDAIASELDQTVRRS